jgi:4-hydroxy-2-oxoheptanedioate aldolase
MEYLPSLADKTVCCLLIETVEALENIDAILAVDGVDMAFVAPFGLSTSRGISGQFGNPVFVAAVRRIEAAAKKAKIPRGGGPANTKAEIDDLFSRGYRIVGGFDILQLKRIVGDMVGLVRSYPG